MKMTKEIQKNREEFKRNPAEYFASILREEWADPKERPKRIFQFFGWAFLWFALFAGIQFLNNDLRFCTGYLDGVKVVDGPLHQSLDEWNLMIERIGEEATFKGKTIPKQEMACEYNFTKWKINMKNRLNIN